MSRGKSSLDQLELYYARDREEWHSWLSENHETSPGVWLIYHKKNSKKTSVSYEDAVQEALSFGWIDSKVNALDEERYMQVFTPRKPGSNWSKSNKKRVEQLIEQGLMEPAGLKKVETAKKDGSWTFLDDIEDMVVPEDLKKALNKNKVARENFETFNDSNKKQLLYWIATAKRNKTRIKRINTVVKSAIENKMPID
ncbi:MAG: YdeI/OmpD-associated family protein [Methanobacterium sp.]|nr:YdeI/OmpD-associated family protein [Methanobacterium sp.]